MTAASTTNVDALRDKMPEPAKDLRLNLQNALKPEKLSEQQAWGVALTSAYFLKDAALRDALLADAREAGVSDETIDDAQAAAALMGMNTVYYRFRHLIGNEKYSQMRAGLRMQRMMSPATSKADFELFSMACAVLAGCQMCMKAHEASITKAGLSEEHVHEAAKIASIISGASTALSI